MRKYLMTGVAALAICAAFTSCSKGGELYDQGAIDQGKAVSIVESYNQAFLKYIGANSAADIPANQTWGFGGYVAGTRNNGIDGAINVNGNMWTGAPAVEVPGEVNAIYDYVKFTLPEMDRLGHLYSTTAPQNLNGYFVTQVRNGYNDDNKDLDANNQWVTNEGQYMNHLQIAFNANPSMADLNNANSHDNISGWEHINNFNASQNANWANDQSELHGNTKVENKGALDFAYHNSLDSKYHNNWILVDGYNITSDHRFANFYYVCFDFESTPDFIKTKFTFTGKTSDGNNYQDNYNGEIDGYYTTPAQVLAALQAAGDTFTALDGVVRNVSEISNIALNGYQNGDKKVDPDDIHTDWIIRITKGTPPSDPDDVCIIAEDLSATDATDFDFNDVVFTVHYTSTTTATVTLYAAGGTLPLTVAGREVHSEFGYGEVDEKGLYKMINTNRPGADGVNGVATVSFDVSNIQKSNRGNDIEIKVDKGEKNANGVIENHNWLTLTATGGQPAAKLCVGADFATEHKWCDERESIKTKYPVFSDWALNNPTQIWWR
jgi:hypothetical protein